MKKRQVKQGMEKDKSKRGKTPLYIEIISDFRQKIIEGELPDGSFLPSERHMAELLGVHRNTVTKAYNELKAEGLLNSLHGFGYKVSYKENCENTGEYSQMLSACQHQVELWLIHSHSPACPLTEKVCRQRNQPAGGGE